MTSCPKCNAPMHDKAELCLQCGYRIQHKTITTIENKPITKEQKTNISSKNNTTERKTIIAHISDNNTDNVVTANVEISKILNKKTVRFIFTLLWGFIGSYIINHSSLKPTGWKSRTCAYFFLGILTFGIYSLAASICNFVFDENQQDNMGYLKE